MSHQTPGAWFHSNRYCAQAACEHCDGVVSHEPWCITRNAAVFYAYKVLLEPAALTIGDSLILHSLGASWTRHCPCESGPELSDR